MESRGDGEGEHRRVGGIGLAVDRRRGQVGRQKALRGIDGGLHFFFGDVDIEREIELQNDDRGSAGAGGGHLAEPLHLAELALERSGDGGGHHVGAGAGIEGQHLDGGVIHLGQRRDGQLREGDETDKQDRGHQQRGCDWPQNKWSRRTHGALLSLVSWGTGCLEMMTLEPVWSFSKLLVATISPGLMPSTAVMPLSEVPAFTSCFLAT